MTLLDLFRSRRERRLAIAFTRKGGWLGGNLPQTFAPPVLPPHRTIEKRAAMTQAAGERPLWEGYRDVARYPVTTRGTRQSDEVRTHALMGRLFSWLASRRRDPVIVEFGTAFGVSGMYWLAGIGGGHLYTFEPNTDWASFARENLAAISDRFTLTNDTFESASPRLIEARSVDIGFIDAIHTREFVDQQFEILRPLMKPGGLVLFDDVNFSPDMAACWQHIQNDPSIVGAVTIDKRVGIIEV